MIAIQENQCAASDRKDCSLKTTCQLRHSNEEVGKNVEYYTHKFKRAADFIDDQQADAAIPSQIPVSNFVKETLHHSCRSFSS